MYTDLDYQVVRAVDQSLREAGREGYTLHRVQWPTTWFDARPLGSSEHWPIKTGPSTTARSASIRLTAPDKLAHELLSSKLL